MTGNIAQIAALISFGNHYVTSGQVNSEFFMRNSAFQYCSRVDFWSAGKPRRFVRSDPKLISTGPTEWFEYLRRSGADHLRFKYVPAGEQGVSDYMMAGLVGGGGRWLIEELVNDKCIEWSNQWKVVDEDNPEEKIWSVSYYSYASRLDANENVVSVHSSVQRLESALKEIARFAVANDFGWVDHFENAVRALSSQTPEVDFYHQDLLVPNMYSLEKRQLFYAAGLAWCFGGMGSWNDVWIESDDLRVRHEKISSELFYSINQAFATVLS